MTDEFKRPESVSEWKQVEGLPEGAREIILYQDSNSKTYARILRLEPGFKGGEKPLSHEFDEIVYIVEGGLINRLTGEPYPAGRFASFSAGTEHGPFDAPFGGLMIEFRHYKK
jgi:hypothetical protein